MNLREAGRRGGLTRAKDKKGRFEAAAAVGTSPLTLEQVEAKLGALDTVEDAMRWLRQIAFWAAGGLLSGTVASSAVRACEVWLKLHDSEVDRKRLKELERKLAEYEKDSAKRGAGALRRA